MLKVLSIKKIYDMLHIKIVILIDAFGRTALDYAAYHGRFESLVLLIELGAQTE